MDPYWGPEEQAEHSGDTFQQPPADAWPARRWLLVIGVGFCAGVGGWFVASSLWPGKRPQPGSEALPAGEVAQQGERPESVQQLTSDQKQFSAASKTERCEWTPVAQATVEDLKEEEIEVARQLVEDLPRSPDSLALMAQAAKKYGKSSEAIDWWQRCLLVGLDPDRADAYHAMAAIALEKADPEEAVTLSRKAVAIDSSQPGYHLRLAESLMTCARPTEAIEVLQNALEVFPNSSQGHLQLGQAYLELKEYEKAKQRFAAAIDLGPALPESYFGLATVCARLGQRNEAKEHREKFKSLFADRLARTAVQKAVFDDLRLLRQSAAETHTSAGIVYQAHGNAEIAERHWLRAASLDPDNTVCRTELARTYLSTGRDLEALPWCEQLVMIEPSNPLRWLDLGITNARLKRFDAAESALLKASQRMPQSSVAYVTLARLYLETNRKLLEATRLAQVAVGLEPTAGNYVLLSAACEKGGNRAGAVSAIERAIELEPENPEYREICASIREKK